MKKQPTSALLAMLLLLFAQNVQSQILTRPPTTLNTLPATSVDALRVSNGLISQLISGSVGGFGATDQWIGIGSPLTSPVLYGERTQWNGQFFAKALRSQNPSVPSAVKDAILEWGNLGGEMQFRYVTNPAVPTANIKIHTLTSAGNAYYGTTAPPAFFGVAKTSINTADQAGFNSTSVNKISVVNGAFRTTPAADNIYGVGAYTFTNSTANNNTNYGLLSRAQGTGLNTRNYGVYSIASGLSTGINYAIYGNAPVGANSWAGYFQGNVFSTGLYVGSDKDIKTNVLDEKNMLPEIMKVRPVNFNYNTDLYKDLNLSPEKQHGFIAQELATVFPEVVKTSRYSVPGEDGLEADSKTFLSVNYVGLISILFRGIQEQQAQIEELRLALSNPLRVAAANVGTETPATTTNDAPGERKIVTAAGSFEVNKFTLSQNTPNPFSASTTISYAIPDGVKNAAIAVFDLNGRMQLQFNGLNGRSQVTINGNSLQPGMYIYSLLADGQEVISKRMILTK